jgi:hypothetical protein
MPSDPSLVSLVDRDAALEWYRRNRTRSLQLFAHAGAAQLLA